MTLLLPAHGAYLGVMMSKTRKDDEITLWHDFIQQTGSPLPAAHIIYAWGLPVPSWRESWHLSEGRTPLVSWGPPDNKMQPIIEGTYDSYIRDVARGIKALGQPIWLRWFWEMEGRHFAATAESPGQFIAAWRHIQSIFKSEGVTNVAWVWCPDAWGFHTGESQKYYPGDSFVDWLGADGFDGNPAKGKPSTSFDSIFRAAYDFSLLKKKPMMVPATGVANGTSPPWDKSVWIDAMSATLRSTMRNIRAVFYFNIDKRTYDPNDLITYKNRLDETPASFAAWKKMAGRPYFHPH